MTSPFFRPAFTTVKIVDYEVGSWSLYSHGVVTGSWSSQYCYCLRYRNGTLRTQESRFSLLRTRGDKCSPFTAWSRSEYSHACFDYCQDFLPCPNFYLPGPYTVVFSMSSPNFFGANAVSRAVLRSKIGHPAHSHTRFKQVSVMSA